MRGRAGLPGLALVALAVAACGTTVPLDADATRQLGPDALPLDTPDLAGTPGAAPGEPTVQAPGPATSGPRAPGSSPASAGNGPAPEGRSGGGPVGSPGLTGPGVTPTTITIGSLTSNGAGEFQKQLGVNGATGDQIRMNRAVVDWLNTRGGIAGRRITLVPYDVPTADIAADPATAFQAACAAFTQDNKVFAVASILSDLPPTFYECLRKAGVLVTTANATVSGRFYRQYEGTLYGPHTPSYTRILANSVEALWQSGWLTPTSTVGVVGYDTPDARASITDGLLPALRRRGLALDEEFYTSTGTGAASEYSSGVLRFRTAGVDRIFFAPGGQPYYVAVQAQSQGYRPLMSLSTLEFPAAIAANLPAESLQGASGIGWSPDLDLDNSRAAGVSTPGRAQCLQALRAAEQDLSTGTTLAIGTWICDNYFFLRDGLARATSVHRTPFQAAVNGLGTSFRSATTFQTRFAAGRGYDAASAYRLNAFQDECACFRYVSPVRPMP